jgi:hypothetical protein
MSINQSVSQDIAMKSCGGVYRDVFACGNPIKLKDVENPPAVFDITIELKLIEFLKSTGKTREFYGDELYNELEYWGGDFNLDMNTLVSVF